MFPSDHFPVHFELKIKVSKNTECMKSTANKWKGPEKPTEETRQRYSKDFSIKFNQAKQQQQLNNTNTDDNDKLNIKIKALNEAMTEAAETHLERHKHLERDSIFSEDLEEMFKTRQRLKEEG